MNLAVITGASSGIGLALAKLLLGRGYTVVNLSRRPCPEPQVKHIPTDLAATDFFTGVDPILTPLLQESERVALIHNASRYLNDDSTSMPDEGLRDVLEVNVVAPNTLNRHVLPYMKTGSSIVFVGSTLAEKAVKGCFSYVSTKHAQIGMMRALCQDLAGREIHTACVCPGFTDTEMLRSHVSEAAMQSVAQLSTFGRLIRPEEIATTIAWTIENPVVNGSVIHANLGQVES